MPDVFKIEQEKLRTAILPNLVSNNYAQEWEERKKRMLEAVREYNLEQEKLERQNNEELTGSLSVAVNSGTIPQINHSYLLEVPE